MKTWLAAITGGIIGAAIALYVAQSFWMRAFRTAIPTTLQSLEEKQQYSSMVSLAALHRLESGDEPGAKQLLAREIVSYYRYPFNQPESPQRKNVLSLIDTERQKSPTLDAELRKKTP
jgi:hypothetical protein